MTSAVAGWLPIRPEVTGEAQPEATPAIASPPETRRRFRRDRRADTLSPPERTCDVRRNATVSQWFTTMQGCTASTPGTRRRTIEREGDETGRALPPAADVPRAVDRPGRHVGVRRGRRRPGPRRAL